MPAKMKSAMTSKHEKELLSKGFISEERYSFLKSFLRESVDKKQCSYLPVDKNDSVLPSSLTRMVNFIVDEKMQTILTIDTDALVRVWSMLTGSCVGSYPIEQARTDDSQENTRKLTACNVDRDLRYIVVAFEGGKVQVNNLHSGGLIYNEAENTMVCESEVSELRFFGDNCNYMFVATCWEGRVAFFAESQMNRGRNYVKVQ